MPPAARILQLATAGWMSQAMSAFAELGVADELAAGPRPVDEIAKAVEAHGPTLYRLLRAVADIGLLTETVGRVFGLTELGEALRGDAPGSLRNFVWWTGLATEREPWTRLADAVRSGRPVFEDAFGRSVWDHMGEQPEVLTVFDRAMTELSRQIIAPVVAAYDWSFFGTVVDVGGGRGALLAAVLAAAPQAKGVLFDQAGVISDAGRPLEEAGVSDRCELVAGSFFDAVPAGGDAYLLSNIIHDWDDDDSVRILANCRNAMNEDGRVLLVEAVLPDGEPALNVKLMDLDMLVLLGGGQRTAVEFGALLTRAGLRPTRVVPGGHCSVVEAVRA